MSNQNFIFVFYLELVRKILYGSKIFNILFIQYIASTFRKGSYKLNQKFPKDSDLKVLAERLRHRPFLYLSSLGDMLGRFQESILKVPLRFTALSLLIRRGGSLTPTELAKLMLRSKHSITNIIDGLENEGYIVRDRDNQDRRVVNIKITTDGLRHMQEKVYNENPIITNMMSCLNEKETEQLLDYIKRLRKELIKVMTEVPPNS